jgi:hypothetical protein
MAKHHYSKGLGKLHRVPFNLQIETTCVETPKMQTRHAHTAFSPQQGGRELTKQEVDAPFSNENSSSSGTGTATQHQVPFRN